MLRNHNLPNMIVEMSNVEKPKSSNEKKTKVSESAQLTLNRPTEGILSANILGAAKHSRENNT